MTEQNTYNIKPKQHLFYAQILPPVGEYNVLEMIVCTLYPTYFAAMEKRDKHRKLFKYDEINKTIFLTRSDCLDVVKEAEAHKKKISNERYYEED